MINQIKNCVNISAHMVCCAVLCLCIFLCQEEFANSGQLVGVDVSTGMSCIELTRYEVINRCLQREYFAISNHNNYYFRILNQTHIFVEPSGILLTFTIFLKCTHVYHN